MQFQKNTSNHGLASCTSNQSPQLSIAMFRLSVSQINKIASTDLKAQFSRTEKTLRASPISRKSKDQSSFEKDSFEHDELEVVDKFFLF